MCHMSLSVCVCHVSVCVRYIWEPYSQVLSFAVVQPPMHCASANGYNGVLYAWGYVLLLY